MSDKTESDRLRQTVSSRQTTGKFCDRSLADICEAVGGIEAFRRISRRFHHKVEADPALNVFFPRHMKVLEERLALYLAELTGGPPEYSAARGKTSLGCRHAHLAIGPTDAERWLALMSAAIEEEGLNEENRDRVLSSLGSLADSLVDPFVRLYRLPIGDLRAELEQDPSLAVANHHGRNLICAAAIGWDVQRMRLLLEFGADVNATDAGGHNPLYRAANGAGREDDGQATIKLLVEHGANVNQVTGVGGMTPLHMAARRGTVTIAGALLDAGAYIEAKDRKGETPLRRAVNCGHARMVRFLISRGANPLSPDSKGRTPRDAARTESMRRALLGEQRG